MDPSELQANANRAIDSMLHIKRSIDIKRQRGVWELGVMLCQNESQEAASVAEAKVICSQVTLDAWTACSQSVLEAKTNFLAVVKEAKTLRGRLVQEAEAACSKAICEARAQKISQALMLHKEHGRYMQGLEEQAFGEESIIIMTPFPPVRSPCVTVHNCLKGVWLLRITSSWGKHLHCLHSFHHR